MGVLLYVATGDLLNTFSAILVVYGLYMAVMSFAKKGGEDNFGPSASDAAMAAGAVVRAVVSTIEEGFALPPVAEFEKLITPRTKAILICNPNNPTGYLYTRSEMNKIRDLVKKYDLFLISDEVYREFCYTNAPYISAFHLDGIEDNVILIDSVSKRYSECGVRVGALVTKNKEVRLNV